MSELDSNVVVDGPFAAQPSLVKAGSIVAFAALILFGSYIPTSLVVAIIAGVGTSAANWKGEAGALGIVAAVALVGAWTNCGFLRWLRGGVLSFRARCLFISGCIVCSLAVASVAAALHVWPAVFLTAFAAVVLSLVLSWVLIKVGQTMGAT